MVATNADVMHSYRDLLKGHRRGAKAARGLARKRWSPSLFVVHFGLKGEYPDIAHHSILFGPRYAGLLDDIYDKGVLPEDFSLYLHHPTATDKDMAPPGHATFYALAPVGHMGKLDIDWTAEGPKLERRIIDAVGERCGIPDIHDKVVTSVH